MKKSLLVLPLLSLVALVLPAKAQIVVSYVGSSTGGTMPGSATDFIFFNGSTYNSGGGGSSRDNGGADNYSKLDSFSFAGSVQPDYSNGNYSVITTPAGDSVTTGDLKADNPLAFAVEPTQSNPVSTLSTPFDYNDFDMYIMYSNTDSAFQDATISVNPRSSNQNSGGPYGGPLVTVNLDGTQAPTDTNTSSSTAYYLEFHITGLQTAIDDGYSPDLVVSATEGAGYGTGYVGGVSFVSAPESSTWAMLLGGVAFLGFIVRRKSARFAL
jgi:hypothetical protein